MYTTHSIEELQTTSRTPTLQLPRGLSQEFDRDELGRQALEMEPEKGKHVIRRGIRRLIETLRRRLLTAASLLNPRRASLS